MCAMDDLHLVQALGSGDFSNLRTEIDQAIEEGLGDSKVMFVFYDDSNIEEDEFGNKFYAPVNTTFNELKDRFDDFTRNYPGSDLSISDSLS